MIFFFAPTSNVSLPLWFLLRIGTFFPAGGLRTCTFNRLKGCPAQMAKKHITVLEGSPHPRGATWNGKGTNFALFSAHATKVELCLFDKTGTREQHRIPLPEYTDEIWHGYVPDIGPGTIYGYRVHGPHAPEEGHRFNHNKLLLDPYAREYHGRLQWHSACFGYKMDDDTPDDRSFDEQDSAPYVPKSVVTDTRFEWRPETVCNAVPWDQTIIYEAHIKGFTRLHPDVAEKQRGTYAGMADPQILTYLRDLGVTSVEIMPVQAFVDDKYLVDKGLSNYWGYNSIGFFTPDPRYAANKQAAAREFKQMVAAFHDAGLEVILDVVYNHTAEGAELGPTLSFRGIDNASYYCLQPEQKRYYINDSGTGNTLNLPHPRVLQMVMDSLRYWVTEMHVDGFRFDLGSILAREEDGFDVRSGFLKACCQDPVLNGVKMIAEPWDCGIGGYQVGGFPHGWAEWNDKFRDTVRDFWRSKASVAALRPRLCASDDVFRRRSRRPWASVNFVTAHDGFTLHDLVSYNDKHNDANQDDGGHADNRSWNCGAEGVTRDKNVLRLRLRQMKNFMATLLCAQGTPMIAAGDERARTQKGNNNTYCQDNEYAWIDWRDTAFSREMLAFTKRMITLRRTYPVLRHAHYLCGTPHRENGPQDVTWIKTDGSPFGDENDWEEHIRCFGMLLDGTAPTRPDAPPPDNASLLIILNGHYGALPFTLPAHGEGKWNRLLDTNLSEERNITHPFTAGDVYTVTARSLLLFEWLGPS